MIDTVKVKCSVCKKHYIFDEPSPLHLSHRDRHMICDDCEEVNRQLRMFGQATKYSQRITEQTEEDND